MLATPQLSLDGFKPHKQCEPGVRGFHIYIEAQTEKAHSRLKARAFWLGLEPKGSF